jgi:hypothetical protein
MEKARNIYEYSRITEKKEKKKFQKSVDKIKNT